MGLVTRHIPDTSLDENLKALQAAMKEANRFGVTAVSDIPGLSSLNVYEKLLADGLQTVRFALYPTGSASAVVERAKSFKGKRGSVEIRGFKAYMDGNSAPQPPTCTNRFLTTKQLGRIGAGFPCPT